MRILIISDTIEFSGAEEAILNLANALSRDNATIRLCSTRFLESQSPKLPFEDSVVLHTTPPRDVAELYRSLGQPSTLARTVLHSLRAARDFQPDIVHSGVFLSLIPSMIVAKSLKIPVVAHVNDYRTLSLTDSLFLRGKVFEPSLRQEFVSYLETISPHEAMLSLGLRRVIRALYNRCDLLIAVSNFVKNSLSDLLKPPIEVVHPVVSELGQAGPTEKNEGFTVVYSGRLVRGKGFHIFLEAAKLLLKKMSVNVHITGSGILEPLAKTFAKDYAPYAHFHGYLPNQQVRQLVSKSHVTVHPSLWPEPCPLSVIKSVALGTAALGSDRGGMTELLPAKYLFEPEPKEICKAVARYFEDQDAYPPSLALDLSPETISGKVLDAYKELL